MNPGAIYALSPGSGAPSITLEIASPNSNSMVLPVKGSRPLHFILVLVYAQHTHTRAYLSCRKQAKRTLLKTAKSGFREVRAPGTTDNRFPRRAGPVCQSR